MNKKTEEKLLATLKVCTSLARASTIYNKDIIREIDNLTWHIAPPGSIDPEEEDGVYIEVNFEHI